MVTLVDNTNVLTEGDMEKKSFKSILWYFAVICYPLAVIFMPLFFETYFKNNFISTYTLSNQFLYFGYLFLTQIVSGLIVAVLIITGKDELKRKSSMILLCAMSVIMLIVIFMNYNLIRLWFINIWFSPKEFMLCLSLYIILIIASIVMQRRERKLSGYIKTPKAPQGAQQGVPPGMPQGIMQGAPQGASPEIPQGALRGVQQEMPLNAPQNVAPYGENNDDIIDSLYK